MVRGAVAWHYGLKLAAVIHVEEWIIQARCFSLRDGFVHNVLAGGEDGVVVRCILPHDGQVEEDEWAVGDGDSKRVATVLGHVRQLARRDYLRHGVREETRAFLIRMISDMNSLTM